MSATYVAHSPPPRAQVASCACPRSRDRKARLLRARAYADPAEVRAPVVTRDACSGGVHGTECVDDRKWKKKYAVISLNAAVSQNGVHVM